MARRGSFQLELKIEPIKNATRLRSKVYSVLKEAINQLDIYEHAEEIRLDECKLAKELAVSRTPVREALTFLEQEGFVRTVPRRGAFVVRRTKSEIVEMIIAWAALESMAARLAASRATLEEFSELHAIMDRFKHGRRPEHMNEYSSANIDFHEKIIALGHCETIAHMTRNLFLHVRGIRKMTIYDEDRAERSVTDHMNIIHALEARDPDLAQRLVREHALDLAMYVEKHGNLIDSGDQSQARHSHFTDLSSRQPANNQTVLAQILQDGTA